MASASQNNLRIVLLGRTGNGKSATGNALLKQTYFHAQMSGASITNTCTLSSVVTGGINLRVVDTPGFFDTNPANTNEMIKSKITSQIFDLTSPGVHAFVIVLRIGRFSPEEKNAVNFIKEMFGADAAKYCVVLFTHEDALGEEQTLDDFIGTDSQLRDLVVNVCGNRKLSINNKASLLQLEKKTQQLVGMITAMVSRNGGSYYTNAQYQQIERAREEKRKQLEREEQEKKAKDVAAIQQKARDEEQRRFQKEREEERKKTAAREQALQDQLRNQSRGEGEQALMSGLMGLMSQMALGGRMAPTDCMSSRNPCYDSMPSYAPVPSHSPMPSYGGSMRSGTHQRPQSSSSYRNTGERVVSRGSANGRQIMEGRGGGRFTFSDSGNKVYRKN